MKRVVFNDLRLTLAVLLLAAAAVDLLLPSPHCKDSGAESARISGTRKAPDTCIVPPPMASDGLREP